MLVRLFLAAFAALLLTPDSLAQCANCPSGETGPIKVSRVPLAGGTPQVIACRQVVTGTNDIADFSINLDSVPGGWGSAQNWVLHIYDCNLDGSPPSAPTRNIGRVTIQGDPSGIAHLAITVSPQWLEQANLGLDEGAVDFGGIEIAAEALRFRTRVSVAITGDITPVGASTEPADMKANQFVRVQVEGRDGVTERLGGTIEGDIIAYASLGHKGYDGIHDAIGQVRAWRHCAGLIEATEYHIERVQVMGDPAAAVPPVGITGDIVADLGTIRSIFCAGPIGDGVTRITAGSGIGEILTVGLVNNMPTILDKDINAEITANQVMIDDPENFPYAGFNADGVLVSLETLGDLRGSVRAANIAAASNLSGRGRRGIYVNGICYAPITVDFVVDGACIVARTFLEPISIGRSLHGTVVATGGATTPYPPVANFLDGHIPFIEVGRAELDQGISGLGLYRQISPGVTAGNIPVSRVYPTPRADWFADVPANEPESVIHAEYQIGEADIASLQGASYFKFAPAIESPVIGTLTIDAFAYGSVWSGQVDVNDANAVYARRSATSSSAARAKSPRCG